METYDQLADFYDHRHENPWTKRMRQVEKPLLRMARGKILDVGCGTGYHLKLFPDAIGVDCSEGMLKEAKRHGHVVKAYAERLPFADESFDTALCMFTVLNQCEINKVAKEIARVVKSNGLCIVSVASVYDRGWSFQKRLRIRDAQKQKVFSVKGQKIRLRLFTKDEVEATFRENGFNTERFIGLFTLATPKWGDSRPLTMRQKIALFLERILPGEYGALYLFAFRKS